MISNKEFFEQLREGEEYLSALMTKQTYSGIDFEMRQLIVVGDVRQKNTQLNQDDEHKRLVRELSKAKAKLIDYEYGMNIGK